MKQKFSRRFLANIIDRNFAIDNEIAVESEMRRGLMFRDKVKNPLCLEGKYAVLDEIAPKYFSYVIEWRNNPELNKFLNQPFVLTEELERKWYEDVYLKDDTGFMIMIDKASGTPFGTLGWANLDLEKRRCTGERLILGNQNFRVSAAFWESGIILNDYLFQYVDIKYGHVVIGNTSAVRYGNMYGGVENHRGGGCIP